MSRRAKKAKRKATQLLAVERQRINKAPAILHCIVKCEDGTFEATGLELNIRAWSPVFSDLLAIFEDAAISAVLSGKTEPAPPALQALWNRSKQGVCSQGSEIRCVRVPLLTLLKEGERNDNIQ